MAQRNCGAHRIRGSAARCQPSVERGGERRVRGAHCGARSPRGSHCPSSRWARHPPSPLGVGSAVNCLRTTTLEPDFGFLPTARDMTRCRPGSVDSSHEPGVAVLSQCAVNLRPSPRGPQGFGRFRHLFVYQDNPGHAHDRACRSGVLDSGAARHGGLRCYSCRCSAPRGGKAPIAPLAVRRFPRPEAPGHEPGPRQKSGRNRITFLRHHPH
jgi:hypothetical protein